MSRFTDYTQAAQRAVTGEQQLVVTTVVDLIDPTGKLLATTDTTRAVNGVVSWRVDGATIQLDPDRTLSRTVTISAYADDAVLVPAGPGSLLHPETLNRVRIALGLADGTASWTAATLLIETTRATSHAGAVGMVEVELVDPGRPLRSTLVDPVPWDAAETVETVVARLLAVVGDDTVDLAETGYTMPAAGAFGRGKVVADAVQELLGGCGHELTADDDGRLFSRPIPPTKADNTEIWLYGGSQPRLPVPFATRTWRARSPEGVLVSGGAMTTDGASFTVPAWDTDPDSEGHYSGPGEVQVETLTYPHIATANQAIVAGYGRLRRIGSGPATIDMQIAPNPAMRPGDLVDLEASELQAPSTYRVRRIGALPTQMDQLQQVTLRAVWDPEIGRGAPADPITGCGSSGSDSFDRSDQNLEDLEDSPGSPYWTELAWSWAVVGNQAIQRHNGTPSMARWNTPMCGSDCSVTGVIGSNVPTGKWIGVYGRSTSEFDGYAAVVDSAGRIRLELWQAGKRIAELASYSTGDTDTGGKTLVLTCDGTDLVVSWEGVEVIETTDTRMTGVWVGMHGLGGVEGSTAPGMASWSATLL